MLEYMCPGYLATGHFPPDGSDSRVCPRPVLGTYDDHDYTWNNGNGRLPHKQLAKQVFLDALGVPADSPRRLWGRGIECASLVCLSSCLPPPPFANARTRWVRISGCMTDVEKRWLKSSYFSTFRLSARHRE